MRTRLYLSHEPSLDILHAKEFGTPDDGVPADAWRPVSDNFGFLHLGEHGPAVGFTVHDFSTFDADAEEVAAIWDEPLFDVPGPRPAGGAGRRDRPRRGCVHFGDRPSLNRRALRRRGEQAGRGGSDPLAWCLEAGDSMAHFAIGYTLYELGRFQDAYRHLRYYAEIAPAHPWNWVWFGKAATALGARRGPRRLPARDPARGRRGRGGDRRPRAAAGTRFSDGEEADEQLGRCERAGDVVRQTASIVASPSDLTYDIWTDGACADKPSGAGGYAAVLVARRADGSIAKQWEVSGGEASRPRTTGWS